MSKTVRELAIASRSYRGYDESRKVTREELLDLVDLTRYTPSSVNRQPLKYHIAWEKAEVDQIQSLTKWAAGLPDLQLPYPGTCPTGFIVICLDTKLGPNEVQFLKDVGIVAQTMLLAATEEGLGGCMIGNFNPQIMREALHLEEHLKPMLVVAVGRPAEKVVLTEVGEDGSTGYYRDEAGVHYVPKRKLEDILV